MPQAVTTDVPRLGKYESITQTTSVLGGYSQGSQSVQRQEMLTHANADQINAVSEMVMNLLKNRIPVKPRTLDRLKRHKKVLREVGKRRNSLKRRREHLVRQTGNGFWQGLKECYGACR